MKNFQCKNVMCKKKLHPNADEFSDDDMDQIKHFGQMLGGGVTPFEEAVEEAFNKRQAAREANAKKMHNAQTGGGDVGLAPSQMDQGAIKQRGAIAQQSATQGAEQAVQAENAQTPVNAPPAPAGPQGSYPPYPAQKRGCRRSWQRRWATCFEPE
jgi:hypothetical protein